MSALPESSSTEIQKWIRELLGARGYFRAINDSKLRTRIRQLADSLDRGELDRDEVRAAFARATYRHTGIEDLLDEFESLPRPKEAPTAKMPSPSTGYRGGANRSGRQTEIAVQAVENQVEAMRLELDAARRHARELENLVRGLVERSVFDATRIRGLETAMMSVAERVGSAAITEELYSAVTADFLTKRFGK